MGRGEIVAMLITLFAHMLGIAYLLCRALIGSDGLRSSFGGWWPRFRDDPDGDSPTPPANPSRLPLSDAVPARKRLRAPGRLVRKRSRRPDHSPINPVRQPVRDLSK